MNKKTFVVILGLSVVVNEVVAIVDAIKRGRFLAGEAGLPFHFSYGSLFDTGNVNYWILLLDIAFWFFIIWMAWIGIKKLAKK